MKIIVDAMGTDNHPLPEVEAVIQATQEFGEEIVLVGQENILTPLIKEKSPNNSLIRVVHASEVFKMTDKLTPGALRKAENSMSVGLGLVKSGEGDAFVTMGNTGGAMANGLFRLGRIRGVKRPALCGIFPVKNGHAIVTDIGANAECRPEYLLQFGVMGSVYAQTILDIENPRVGLLSNGEEANKGNDLVKATYPLLAESGLNFVGNVEGKELFGGEADVVVTDGFTGNVLLKTSEAVAKMMTEVLREKLSGSLLTKVGAGLAMPAFRELRRLMDPSEVGAVPLLGLNGLVFVGHGRSQHRAVFSAIRLARQSVERDLLGSIHSAVESSITQLKNAQAG